MAFPLSLAFLTVRHAGPEEAIRIAAEAGYDMVGLRLLPAAATEAPYALMTDGTLQANVEAALRDTGIAFADMEIVRLKPETDVAEFEAFCALGQRLGARNVLVAGDDPDHDRLTETFGRFAELAAAHCLTADLEFMPWTAVKTLEDARKIVEAAGAANGGVLIDALHYDRSDTTIEEVRALDPSRINYAQICDGPVPYDPSDEGLIAIARNGRLLPGDGGIDLAALIHALPDGTPISVEIPSLLELELGPLEFARRAADRTRALIADRLSAAETR